MLVLGKREEIHPLDLIRKLRDMPESQIVRQIESLDSSIFIFERNYQELKQAIEFYSFDKRGEHLQYLRHRDLQMQLGHEVSRLLHNFAAAAMSLVEHARNLVRHLDSENLKFDDYRKRVDEVFKDDPLSCLVKDLRKFCQHYKVPPILFQTKFDKTSMTKNLGIQKKGLMEFDGWSKGSKVYLEEVEEYVDILEIANEYHEKVGDFYEWFRRRLEEIFGKELSDYKKIEDRLSRIEIERKIDSTIINPEHNNVENTEFLAGHLTSREHQEIERLPFRKRADVVIETLKQRNEISEEYEEKIRKIYKKQILDVPMSECFEDFLIRSARDARGELVPIEYREMQHSEKGRRSLLLGQLEFDDRRGCLIVYINKPLLKKYGLNIQSVETVAAHEILHYCLALRDFPATKTPTPMPSDSAESMVGSSLQCALQEVAIQKILKQAGFNIDEVALIKEKMQVEQLSAEAIDEEPGSANFTMSVLTYVEAQLVGSESYKEEIRELMLSRNHLIVSFGDGILTSVSEVNMNTPEGQLFALKQAVKTLKLERYVVVVDNRK